MAGGSGRDPAPRRAQRGARSAIVVVLVATVLVGLGVLASSGWPATGLFERPAFIDIDGEAVAIPRPAPAEGRLRPAVPVTTEGTHAFLHVHADGAPVGYDPCRPISYVINPAGMPEGAQDLIDEALTVVSAASGLVFRYAGTTDEPAAVQRAVIQERYGEGWAPVLIGWSDEAAMPELAGEVAGMGGSAAVPGVHGDGQWLAAGRVVLDSADIAAMLARPDGHAQARAIVVHELAHVLGLDHVSDTHELMHPVSSDRTDLGPGDRQGLALVGQAACQ